MTYSAPHPNNKVNRWTKRKIMTSKICPEEIVIANIFQKFRIENTVARKSESAICK